MRAIPQLAFPLNSISQISFCVSYILGCKQQKCPLDNLSRKRCLLERQRTKLRKHAGTEISYAAKIKSKKRSVSLMPHFGEGCGNGTINIAGGNISWHNLSRKVNCVTPQKNSKSRNLSQRFFDKDLKEQKYKSIHNCINNSKKF